MNRINVLLVIISIFCGTSGFAQKTSQGPLLLSSQGISSPSSTTFVNYGLGFTSQNPAGAALLSGAQIDLMYDRTNASGQGGLGAELGYGNQSIGFDVGYYKRDCSGCTATLSLMTGYNFGNMAFGLGYRDSRYYSLGGIFYPSGPHRLGLVLQLYDSPNVGQDLKAFALGYTYVQSSFLLSLDASKQQSETTVTADNIIKWSPGIQIMAQPFFVSIVYDTYTNDDTKIYESTLKVGLGYKSSNWLIAGYYKYVNDLMVSASFSF